MSTKTIITCDMCGGDISDRVQHKMRFDRKLRSTISTNISERDLCENCYNAVLRFIVQNRACIEHKKGELK